MALLIQKVIQKELQAKGNAEGKVQGMKAGEAKGKIEEKIAIAKNLLAQNIDTNIIAAVTSLLPQDIDKLKS